MKRRSATSENTTATKRNKMLIYGCVVVNTFQSTRRILWEGAALPNFVQIQTKCTFYSVGCEQLPWSCPREGVKSIGLQHKTSYSSYELLNHPSLLNTSQSFSPSGLQKLQVRNLVIVLVLAMRSRSFNSYGCPYQCFVETCKCTWLLRCRWVVLLGYQGCNNTSNSRFGCITSFDPRIDINLDYFF